jgi:hypothetical protein
VKRSIREDVKWNRRETREIINRSRRKITSRMADRHQGRILFQKEPVQPLTIS